MVVWCLEPMGGIDYALRDEPDALGDPTLADASLDRLVHHAHPLNLAGESLRKLQPKLTEEPTPA